LNRGAFASLPSFFHSVSVLETAILFFQSFLIDVLFDGLIPLSSSDPSIFLAIESIDFLPVLSLEEAVHFIEANNAVCLTRSRRDGNCQDAVEGHRLRCRRGFIRLIHASYPCTTRSPTSPPSPIWQ
jgi:hypothetical protein